MDSQDAAAPERAASLDVPSQSELDQAAAVVANTTQQQHHAAETDMGTTSSSTGVDEVLQVTQPQADTAADPGTVAGEGSAAAPVASADASSSSGRDRRITGSSSSQQPSLSGADLLRELRSMKSENLELVKMLTAQLQEVRYLQHVDLCDKGVCVMHVDCQVSPSDFAPIPSMMTSIARACGHMGRYASVPG